MLRHFLLLYQKSATSSQHFSIIVPFFLRLSCTIDVIFSRIPQTSSKAGDDVIVVGFESIGEMKNKLFLLTLNFHPFYQLDLLQFKNLSWTATTATINYWMTRIIGVKATTQEAHAYKTPSPVQRGQHHIILQRPIKTYSLNCIFTIIFFYGSRDHLIMVARPYLYACWLCFNNLTDFFDFWHR